MLTRARSFFLLFLFAPLLAFAQDVQTSPDIGEVVSSTSGILAAAKSNRWALFVALIVGLLSKWFAWGVSKMPWAWAKSLAANHFITDKVVPIVGSVAGALATSLAAGQALSVDLVLQALLIGAAAAGWTRPKSQAEVDAAKADAAAAVKTPEDVLNVLGGEKKP